MSSDDDVRRSVEYELDEMKLAEAMMADRAAESAAEAVAADQEITFPPHILPQHDPELEKMKKLWRRFNAWLESEGAGDTMKLNPPTTPHDFFTLQQAVTPEGIDDFELPADVAASFACHDGQDWNSVTGVLGRWYLLDAAAAFAEWRDQCEMVEMGLYTGSKYSKARKALGSHPRIDTSSWFNRGWIPLACSGGRGLGGDLICVDMAAPRALHRGQIILYRPENAERVLIAESWSDWMNQIVQHCEAGVYRWDAGRSTYVAGEEPKEGNGVADDSSAATGKGSDPAAAESSSSSAPPSAAASFSASSASSAAASRPPLPTSASSTIGVEAFLYSAIEHRDLFITNQTEELVYLGDNDYNLLNVDAAMAAVGGDGAGGEAKASAWG